MPNTLFGVETEYAIGGGNACDSESRYAAARQLLELASTSCRNLPDELSSGIFLENGSRFYLDSGRHPEFSTAECANPWDAVRYVEAGHRFILGLLDELNRCGSREPTGCYRVNVDYCESGATWGCHESYLHHADPDSLPQDLIPHLVSRIIYTGAGGFDPLSAGLKFTLSPRASYIRRVVSWDAACDRGIFHAKNEPLGHGYSRLHVIFGENLCSYLAMFLKIGATCLVVAMAEAGLNPGREVSLSEPLDALDTIAADWMLRSPLSVGGNRKMSALEIQRHYLNLAEDNLGRDFMPPWAPQVCDKWRYALDLLAAGPEAASRAIDWCMKGVLYSHHAAYYGLDLEGSASLSRTMDAFADGPAEASQRGLLRARSLRLLDLEADKALRDRIDGAITPCGYSIEDLRRLLEVRPAFFELDTRFGQLGPEGVFTQLDQSGVLAHRLKGVDNIEHAMESPPASGRATVRGRVIRRLAGDCNGKWLCSWRHIISAAHGRRLDLSDPFTVQELWSDVSGEVLPRALPETQ